MGMPLHDHRVRPKAVFCPMMKEMCQDGWTKSMGPADPETGVKPVCNCWRGVYLNDPKATPPIQEIYDCVWGWQNDLLQQIAQEIYQGAAATEGARNQIASQSYAIKRMSTMFVAVGRRQGITAKEIHDIEMSERVAKIEMIKRMKKELAEGGDKEGGDGVL